MKTEFKYKVGEKVLLNGKESVIEQTGISLNHQPLYKIDDLWHKERDITKWYPPCPV